MAFGAQIEEILGAFERSSSAMMDRGVADLISFAISFAFVIY